MRISTSRIIEYIDGMRAEFNYLKTDAYGNSSEKANFPLHTHDDYEIFFFISGDNIIFAEDNIYRISYGDVFIAKPGELHGMPFNNSCFTEHYYILLPQDCFRCLHHDAESLFHSIGSYPRGTGNIIRLTASQTEEACNCLEELRAHAFDLNFSHSLESFTLLIRILNIVCAASKAADMPDPPIHEVLPPEICDLLRYLNNNHIRIHRLDDIAHPMNLSEVHLSRLFKRYMGTTIMHYVRMRKMENAKQMLLTGASVTDACFSSGFDSYSHFITTFRKEYGMSPMEYRRHVIDSKQKSD